jgi:hypothetical protein
LVVWVCRVGTRDFCPALAALVSPVQNMFFFTVHFLNFWCPHRPTCWADSRAGSPVSYYVSLVATVGFLIQQFVSYTLLYMGTKLNEAVFSSLQNLKGFFMVFLPTVFTTASSAETLKFHCI